ncbi:hypothetical protein C2845_PM08G20190 [Panicum miliaceum]|uniref:DUF8039 domain-containing protein n=1 Tax=Panicum miliaceum TaxID=4540 RepID=A0A3L6R2N3_PANMI|nr:hypothetical protein C2845_PM08G20190 [Panicum miliaceum]
MSTPPAPAPTSPSKQPLVEAEESSQEDGNSSGGFETPDEYQPSPPRHRRRLDEEDPEYDPSAENDVESPAHSPRRQCRITIVEEEVTVSAPQPSTTTASTSKSKRKRGERSQNQIPTVCLVVEEVSPRGKPILPLGISARFRNVCGAVARDQLQTWITTNDWKKVPDSTKESMWAALQACFRFPEGKSKEDAKKFAMITLGTAFKNFRHTLHKDYVKKGLSPKSKFGKIPDAMWEEFKKMKNTAEAKALSQQMTEKAQKAAENPHHLGAGGYDGMIPHWRREEEERKKAGLPDPFERIEERAKYWCLARRPRNRGGKVGFENPATAEIYERLAKIVEDRKQDRFQPDREKDQLTAAIGTPKHSGRVRGVSSSLSWKQAFANDPGYKKRDRYKKDLEEKLRAIAKEEFSQVLASQQRSLVPNVAQANQDLTLVQSGLIAPSSVGSTTQHRYPVDDIQVDTPCTLVVPYGRKQNKFQEVTTGMAVTGHVFPRSPAPEYAWVQVVKVMDSACELDITTNDGTEVLGDAINQYVQWHRQDIILQGRPSQELQPRPEANIEHAALSPVPEGNNPERNQTTAASTDGVDEFSAHDPTPSELLLLEANIEAEQSVLPSPQSSPPQITKKPAPQAPPNMPEIPRQITIYEKAPSADVDKFLGALKKMPSSSKNKEKEPVRREIYVMDLFSPGPWECSENYVHGKPFLPHVDLQLRPWELVKFHGWIMKAMKEGITTMTAMVPPSVFNNPIPHEIVIDFEDLHRLYRLQHMDINLITVFCMMQWLEEEKTHKTRSCKRTTKSCKDQEAKAEIKEELHKKERHKVSVYIAKVMLKRVDKKYIFAPYGFDNHWIAILIMPKLGRAVVLDSADYDQKRYMEFIGILQNAYRLYVMKGGPHPQDRKDVMNIRYHFYMPTIPKTNCRLEQNDIDNICADIARFIQREICHVAGEYFDHGGVLALEEHKNLSNWTKDN